MKEMQFLQTRTAHPFKVTLPSLAHASVFWAPGTSDRIYPHKNEYMHDVLDLVSQVVAECAAAGAAYVQLDSPRYTHLVSEEGGRTSATSASIRRRGSAGGRSNAEQRGQ